MQCICVAGLAADTVTKTAWPASHGGYTDNWKFKTKAPKTCAIVRFNSEQNPSLTEWALTSYEHTSSTSFYFPLSPLGCVLCSPHVGFDHPPLPLLPFWPPKSRRILFSAHRTQDTKSQQRSTAEAGRGVHPLTHSKLKVSRSLWLRKDQIHCRAESSD